MVNSKCCARDRGGEALKGVIETLTKLGLRILATNEDTQVIVGMTTDRSLIEIGLLDGVLRVVPTEMKDASMK